MNTLLERTPNIIAAEINSIKDQTRKMLLFNSIEIGRRLAEAKSMVPHGEWGKWLEESVDYSQSTANNLMRIFDEYGSQQISIFDNNAKSQALGNLSYTQAVALLSIPEEEREAFIQEHDIDNMSTRELQQAIKDRDQALKERDELLKEKESLGDELVAKESDYLMLIEEKEKLEEANRKTNEEVNRLKKELEDAEDSGDEEEVERLQEELKAAQQEVEKLTAELNKPGVVDVSVIEKVPPEIEEELKQLRERTKELETKALQKSDKAVLKFGVHFDTLVKCFNDLLAALSEIEDEEAKDRYKKAVSGLITKMSERI